MTDSEAVITIRAASPGDAVAIAALAQLDSAPVPRGDLVTVWSRDRLVVALSRDGRAVIADPFRADQPLGRDGARARRGGAAQPDARSAAP